MGTCAAVLILSERGQTHRINCFIFDACHRSVQLLRWVLLLWVLDDAFFRILNPHAFGVFLGSIGSTNSGAGGQVDFLSHSSSIEKDSSFCLVHDDE